MARWIDRNALKLEDKVRLWVEGHVLAFRGLAGHSVARWVGNEMAVRDKGPAGLPVFHDPAIPYLQVCPLYLEFVTGEACEIHTYQGAGDGWGLCIDRVYGDAPAEGCEEGSIFRTRVLDELPIGLIGDVRIVQDRGGDLVEVSLPVQGHCVTLWSGEIYEETDGALLIVRPDESVLVGVAKQ